VIIGLLFQNIFVLRLKASIAAELKKAQEDAAEGSEKEALLKRLLHEATFQPRKIMILFGPPGAGKGTQVTLEPVHLFATETSQLLCANTSNRALKECSHYSFLSNSLTSILFHMPFASRF
jgi:replication-associated recombination protein RarA